MSQSLHLNIYLIIYTNLLNIIHYLIIYNDLISLTPLDYIMKLMV